MLAGDSDNSGDGRDSVGCGSNDSGGVLVVRVQKMTAPLRQK